MYKLLITDDEEDVRKAIINKIDWANFGFEVVGEAENGKEALEIAEKTVPDVIFTDIKMPFMNGLELSNELRNTLPTVKVVILTGFDEFEYAQKAIKANVMEYVLKPVSSQDLKEILLKVKDKLDAERKAKEDLQLLKSHYISSLPILRDKFLNSLVTRRLSEGEIREKTQQYNVDLRGPAYLVSIISIDSLSFDETASEDNTSFTLSGDLELLKFAILNIAEEIVNNKSSGVLFIHDDYIVNIIVSKAVTEEVLISSSMSVMEEIRQTIEKFLKFTVTIGIGSICDSLTKLSNSYSSAMNALDYRVLLGANKVILINDVEPENAGRILLDDTKQQSLLSSIKVASADEIKKSLDMLLEDLLSSRAGYKDYQIYLLEILTLILKAAKDQNVNMDLLLGPNDNLFSELYRFTDMKEVRDWLLELSLKISQYIGKERLKASQTLVNTAKDYIKKNYNDSELSIEKLCKTLHISPNYFSTIFKKETKTTFLNYLTNIRMEASKELLKTTDLKTFEIAENVGFAEATYFSYSFKKYYGISPSEYRNKA